MKLEKPFVILDLETTGTWIEKDRIIEIALIKVLPDGTEETFDQRVNPGMPIPPFVCELTGIKNEDVKNEKKLSAIANDIMAFIGDADLGGFNLERFDLPLLERELREAGVAFEWRNRNIYDAQKVYHLNERRDLTAAYRFYCKEELKDAHSAMADTRATFEILKAQIKEYGDGDDSLSTLNRFEYKQPAEYYDSDRKFRWWNGKLYMMFGKYNRKLSLQDVVKKDPEYLQWILSADFSDEIKALVENALSGKFPKQDEEVKQGELF